MSSCAHHFFYNSDCNACRMQQQSADQTAHLRRLDDQASLQNQLQEAALAESARQTQILEQQRREQQAFQFSQYLQSSAGQQYQKWRALLLEFADALHATEERWRQAWEPHVEHVRRSIPEPPPVPEQHFTVRDKILFAVLPVVTLLSLVGMKTLWRGHHFFRSLLIELVLLAVVACALVGLAALAGARGSRLRALTAQREDELESVLKESLEEAFGYDPRGSRPWDPSGPTPESVTAVVTEMAQTAPQTFPQPDALPWPRSGAAVRTDTLRTPAEPTAVLVDAQARLTFPTGA